MPGITRLALKSANVGRATSERNNLVRELIRRNYELEFWCYTANHRVSQVDVLTDSLVPHIGDQFAVFTNTDPIATCIDVVATRMAPCLWLVKSIYDTDRVTARITDNPLNQPPEIEYGTNTLEKPLMRDTTGLLIRNSATNPYDPPLNYLEKRQTVTIVQNTLNYDALQASQYIGCVNSDLIGVWGPYHIKLVDRRARYMFTYGMFYYQVTTVLEFRPITYAEFLLDQGFYQRGFPQFAGPGVEILSNQMTLIHDPLDFSIPGNPTLLNGKGRPLREAITHLNGNINNNVTTIPMGGGQIAQAKFPPYVQLDPAGFLKPPNWYWFMKIDNEIMQVLSGNLLAGWQVTVIRGVGGTTAAAHNAGAQITCEPYFRFCYPVDALPLAALNPPLPAF